MAGFQFFRAEVFSQVKGQAKPVRGGGRKNERKLSAREAVQEAVRAEGCTPHISEPVTPNSLYGVRPGELLAWVDGLYSEAATQKVKTVKGEKKQRTDVPILMAAVASFPAMPNKPETTEKEKQEWAEMFAKWKPLCVEFLKEKYGERLISVIEHVDEAHPHIHAFVADRGRPVKPFHEGYRSADEAKKAGEGREVQGVVYRAGCSVLQDQFYARVGQPSGLVRFGPKKPRKTRAEWRADQMAAEHLARERGRVEAMKIEATEQLSAAMQTRRDAQQVHASAIEMKAQLDRRMAALNATEKEAVAAKEKQLSEHQQKKKVEQAAAVGQRVGALLMQQSVKPSTPKKTR